MRRIARLLALAGLGACAACAQGSINSAMPQTSSSSSAHRLSVSQGELFVSNITKTGTPIIYIYPATGNDPQPIGNITDGLTTPRGLAVDSSSNLYVANTTGDVVNTRCYGCTGFVAEYSSGTSKPATIYTAGISRVTNVLVGPDGRMYAAQPQSVVEFPPNSTIPDRAVYLGPHTTATGLALDSAQNLYIAYDNATGIDGNVEMVKAGASQGKTLDLDVHTPVGSAVDASGNLLVGSSVLDHGSVGIFAPGSKEPSQQIKGKFRLPQFLTLDSQDTVVYVADSAYGKVFEYSYPSGQLLGTITSHLTQPFGVALQGASR